MCKTHVYVKNNNLFVIFCLIPDMSHVTQLNMIRQSQANEFSNLWNRETRT